MDSKPFWQSRTFWVNIAAGVVLAIGSPEVTAIIPPKVMPYLIAAVAVINIGLRFDTSKSIK